ncbi:MAG: DNA helicase, partial [Erysipelotrichia bacterium]|nr:DNA helicase [Erysipelotrichia bacterium]
MNNKENMIIVKNKFKTNEIKSCKYREETHEWDVTFNNEKTYSYSFKNVKWLKSPQIIDDCNNYHIRRNGKEFFNVEKIYVFSDNCNFYWHIIFKNGTERDYIQNELEINENCLKDKKSRNVFNYLSKISSL